MSFRIALGICWNRAQDLGFIVGTTLSSSALPVLKHYGHGVLLDSEDNGKAKSNLQSFRHLIVFFLIMRCLTLEVDCAALHKWCIAVLCTSCHLSYRFHSFAFIYVPRHTPFKLQSDLQSADEASRVCARWSAHSWPESNFLTGTRDFPMKSVAIFPATIFPILENFVFDYVAHSEPPMRLQRQTQRLASPTRVQLQRREDLFRSISNAVCLSGVSCGKETNELHNVCMGKHVVKKPVI